MSEGNLECSEDFFNYMLGRLVNKKVKVKEECMSRNFEEEEWDDEEEFWEEEFPDEEDEYELLLEIEDEEETDEEDIETEEYDPDY